jgi:glycosyltransferase involved in cell wall biosynthesis
MRIVYYTYPWFLDHSLSLARAMSELADVHLLLELAPESRHGGWFQEEALALAPGMYPAAPALRRGHLAQAAGFLTRLASFDLVVHGDQRALASAASLTSALRTGARIRALRPDLVHFEHVWTRSVLLFFTTPGVPKMLSIHDALIHEGELVRRDYQVRRAAIARTRRLLFYSRYSQHAFAHLGYARPSSVVPLGVKEIFREWPGPDLSEREHTLLFFGRLAHYKGLQVLYAALPAIAARVPRLRVVVAGAPVEGYQPPPPPPLPAGVVLETCFHKVEMPRVRQLFQQASVVVAPYLDASQSGVVQTAFSFRKPVIASAIGGLPEAVRDGMTGLLVPPGDAAALADAAASLLLNHQLRRQMIEAIGQAECLEFGWAPIARQLMDVYALVASTGVATGP